VPIGGYFGSGKRTGVYGGYLLACYDQENEEYQSICKMGVGLKDNDLQTLFESLSKHKIDKPKSYYHISSDVEQPDDWFEPVQVWELKCADFSLSPVHTAALGLVSKDQCDSLKGKKDEVLFLKILNLRLSLKKA
jgi:DNA ligase-1